MTSTENPPETVYRIRLKGMISPSLMAWFGDITHLPQANDETLLVGKFADQAALRGLLDQLWDLNFTIIAIEKIENERTPG